MSAYREQVFTSVLSVGSRIGRVEGSARTIRPTARNPAHFARRMASEGSSPSRPPEQFT